MTAVGVLGLATGLAVFVVALSFARGPFRDPLPGKSSRVFRVLVDHWEAGSSSPYGPPEAPPLLLAEKDARALASSTIPTHRAMMNRFVGYARDDRPGRRPIRVTVRKTHADFFPMFEVPIRFGAAWSDGAAAQREPYPALLSAALNERLFGGGDSVGRELRADGQRLRVAGVLGDWAPPLRFYHIWGGVQQHTEDLFVPLTTPGFQHYGTQMTWRSPVPEDPEARRREAERIAYEVLGSWQLWVQLDTKEQVASYRVFVDRYVRAEKAKGRFPKAPNNLLINARDWPAYAIWFGNWLLKLGTWLGFLCLVACSINLMNLANTRAAETAAEASLRRSLGATGLAICRQHLVEHVILGALSGVIALAAVRYVLEVVRSKLGFPAGAFGLYPYLAALMGPLAGVIIGLPAALRLSLVRPGLHLDSL